MHPHREFARTGTMSAMAMFQQLPATASHFATNGWDNRSMSSRQVLIVGGIAGLTVSSVVLALLGSAWWAFSSSARAT